MSHCREIQEEISRLDKANDDKQDAEPVTSQASARDGDEGNLFKSTTAQTCPEYVLEDAFFMLK